MTLDKQRAFIIQFLFWLIVSAIIYVIYKYAIPLVLPFLLGFLIAFVLKPIIRKLSKSTKLPIAPVAIVVVLLFYGAIGAVVGLLGYELITFISRIMNDLPSLYQSSILPLLDHLFDWFNEIFASFDEGLMATLSNISGNFLESLSTFVTSLSTWALRVLSNFATKIPLFIVSFIIMIISSFFIAVDYERITTFFKSQIPAKVNLMILDIRLYLKATLIQYLKSYLIIIIMTFVELAIGFTILGINQAILVAILVAILDIFPIIGTGGVVIPWAIIAFFNGDIFVGVGMLILYAIVTVVRQVMEPRIVGVQVGLHPLLTLLSMFVGVRLFGALGLFLVPMTIAVLKGLHDGGKIRLYKELVRPDEKMDID